MNIKKTVKALLIINGLQFIAAILLWLVIGTHVLGRVNPAVYLTIGILLLSSLLTLLGLYAASRYQDDSYRDSMKTTQQWAGHPCGQAAAHFPPGLFHEKRGGARHRPHHCFGNRKGYQGHHQPDL